MSDLYPDHQNRLEQFCPAGWLLPVGFGFDFFHRALEFARFQSRDERIVLRRNPEVLKGLGSGKSSSRATIRRLASIRSLALAELLLSISPGCTVSSSQEIFHGFVGANQLSSGLSPHCPGHLEYCLCYRRSAREFRRSAGVQRPIFP